MRLAYRLWDVHLHRLLEEVQDIPHRFIRYKYLLDPKLAQQEIGDAFDFFGLEVTRDKIAELSAAIIKPEMNHAAELSSAYPPNVSELWEDLVARHAKQYQEVEQTTSEESSPVHADADEYDNG